MAKSAKKTPIVTKEPIPWLYYISLPFRVITWPFYLIYYYLFRVPELPNRIMGAIRMAIFVAIGLQYRAIDMFIIDIVDKYELPKWCASLPMGIIAILMLIGLFLSLMQILGLHDGAKSGVVFSLDETTSAGGSGYDAIDDALEYRETILRSQHYPDKVEELKKTRFVSAQDLSSLSAKSPELESTLGFINTRMRAENYPGKYRLFKEMFGGK